jgi:hypothetical protein
MSFRTKRLNEVAGGISVGSTEITAGTVTGKFLDQTDGAVVLVSNRHVLEGKEGETKVVQPGVYDGGRTMNDVVGTVKRLVKWDQSKPLPWWKRILCILFGWFLEEWCIGEKLPNHLDAGVSTWDPYDPNRIFKSGVYMDDQSIMNISKTHSGDGIADSKVWKVGRTTGVTIGVVRDDSASVKVWYGDKWRVFEDVLVIEGLARGGDSGSPVFLMSGDSPSGEDAICGILFAGSDVSYVACKYKYLESELKVRWVS